MLPKTKTVAFLMMVVALTATTGATWLLYQVITDVLDTKQDSWAFLPSLFAWVGSILLVMIYWQNFRSLFVSSSRDT